MGHSPEFIELCIITKTAVVIEKIVDSLQGSIHRVYTKPKDLFKKDEAP